MTERKFKFFFKSRGMKIIIFNSRVIFNYMYIPLDENKSRIYRKKT